MSQAKTSKGAVGETEVIRVPLDRLDTRPADTVRGETRPEATVAEYAAAYQSAHF